jgi:hypothetical protein
MTDPERFSDRHSCSFARALLAGARDEEPAPWLLRRTLGSIGAAGAVSLAAEAHATVTTSGSAVAGSGATGAVTTGAVAAKGVLATVVKSVGIGGAVAALATGAAFELQQEASQSPNTAPAVDAAEIRSPKRTREAAMQERSPESERTISPDELPLLQTSEPAPMRDPQQAAAERGGASDTVLRDEARLIDRAREAVASGNGGGALRVLEEHRTRFKSPVFQPEALYLRLQALRLLGNEAAARQVAKRLLAAYPNGPQAASARAFLKTPEP